MAEMQPQLCHELRLSFASQGVVMFKVVKLASFQGLSGCLFPIKRPAPQSKRCPRATHTSLRGVNCYFPVGRKGIPAKRHTWSLYDPSNMGSLPKMKGSWTQFFKWVSTLFCDIHLISRSRNSPEAQRATRLRASAGSFCLCDRFGPEGGDAVFASTRVLTREKRLGPSVERLE